MTTKPRMVPVTDPKQIAAMVDAGKYREHLPFWSRDGDTVWIVKPQTSVPVESTK